MICSPLLLCNLAHALLQLASLKPLLIHAGHEPRGLREEPLHLLERQLLRLGEETPEEEGVGRVRDTEEDEEFPPDGRDSYGGDLTDHGVEGERDHGCNADALGARAGVEYLGRDDPRERAGGEAECEIEDPRGEDYEGPVSARVVF